MGGGHLWNPSYFVATVSENTEEQIRRYIKNQKKESEVKLVEKAYKYRIYPNKEQKEKLLSLDKEYGELYKEFWYKWDRTDCKNLDEEFEKFIKARKNGQKYYPQLELVKDNLTDDWLIKANELKQEFLSFNCFISNLNYLRIIYTANDIR